LPKVASQWNSGTTLDSNRSRRVLILRALTTRPPSHTNATVNDADLNDAAQRSVSYFIVLRQSILGLRVLAKVRDDAHARILRQLTSGYSTPEFPSINSPTTTTTTTSIYF